MLLAVFDEKRFNVFFSLENMGSKVDKNDLNFNKQYVKYNTF